ncbi:hypothetical protein [Azospirillum sp. sgz302134]
MAGLVVLAFIVGALVKFYTWLMGNPADTKTEPRRRAGGSFVSEGIVAYSPFIDDPGRIAGQMSALAFNKRPAW